MKSHTPKQFLEVNGKPIILYTIEEFDRHPMVDAIVVVCLEGWIKKLRMIVARNGLDKVVKIVKGGEEGQQSIYNGLIAAREWLKEQAENACVTENDNIVLVHDSVRPMVSEELITQNINNVETYGNSITVAPPTETFIVSENNSHRLYNRKDVHVVRAPQCFRLTDIINLHERAIIDGKKGYKDCCSMLCEYDIPFYETLGDNLNIKITYPTDIIMFRSLLLYREMQQVINVPNVTQ